MHASSAGPLRDIFAPPSVQPTSFSFHTLICSWMESAHRDVTNPAPNGSHSMRHTCAHSVLSEQTPRGSMGSAGVDVTAESDLGLERDGPELAHLSSGQR